MAIIRWSPWDLSRFFDEELNLPSQLSQLGLGQGLNLYETDDRVVAEAALPGIAEDKIDVSLDKNGVVHISASAENTQEENQNIRHWVSSMRKSYNYAFSLPDGVSLAAEPRCETENGVLRMEFPKLKPEPPKKIRVERVDAKKAAT